MTDSVGTPGTLSVTPIEMEYIWVAYVLLRQIPAAAIAMIPNQGWRAGREGTMPELRMLLTRAGYDVNELTPVS